jgi:hypothetical protein
MTESKNADAGASPRDGERDESNGETASGRTGDVVPREAIAARKPVAEYITMLTDALKRKAGIQESREHLFWNTQPVPLAGESVCSFWLFFVVDGSLLLDLT